LELALFDEKQMWTAINSNAPIWTNLLEVEHSNVNQAFTNYQMIFDGKIGQLARALKYHYNTMDKSSVSSPEWDNAYTWSTKLKKDIADLIKSAELSDVGITNGIKLHKAIWSREFNWNYINWPDVVNLIAAGCSSSGYQIAHTDNEGRFKFVVPASSSNVVIFAKANSNEDGASKKYLWLVVVGTPAGMQAENLLWYGNALLKNPFWSSDVNLQYGKTVEVNLSNHNASDQGLYRFLENTNTEKYMLYYGVTVDVFTEKALTDEIQQKLYQ
jgi:hypothetical protein